MVAIVFLKYTFKEYVILLIIHNTVQYNYIITQYKYIITNY